MEEVEIFEKIKEFVFENFLKGIHRGASISDLKTYESLLDIGLMDSTGILELVAFIEEEWKITVTDEELMPGNLDSIDNITRYIDEKVNGQASTPIEDEFTLYEY